MSNRHLSAKDAVLAVAIATGASQPEAGRRAGMSVRTVRRRLDEPHFQQEVTRLRDELVTRTTDRLSSLTDTAVDTLAAAMTADDAPWAVRTRAALGILSSHRQRRDDTEMETRLQVLEADLQEAHERRDGQER